MNRSKIEWCDHTWNPITGCRHNCSYCYAKKMTARFSGDVRLNKMNKNYISVPAKDSSGNLYVLKEPMINTTGKTLVYPFRFEPTFHKYRMEYPKKLKMGNNIFVGAMADIFGNWVPDEWIKEIMDVCKENPIHNYLFLTKNPERYWDLEDKGLLPATENMWYGFSYTNNKSDGWASKYGDKNTFVSVEPLLEDLKLFDEHVLCRAAKWVIIGAETGRRKTKVVPKIEWIDKILRHCDKFQIPVFMKDSLIPIIGEENMRREFPKQLLKKNISSKTINKLYDKCCECGNTELKREMAALSARFGKGGLPKQFAFLCRQCFENLCSKWDVEIPDFERKNGGLNHG